MTCLVCAWCVLAHGLGVAWSPDAGSNVVGGLPEAELDKSKPGKGRSHTRLIEGGRAWAGVGVTFYAWVCGWAC